MTAPGAGGRALEGAAAGRPLRAVRLGAVLCAMLGGLAAAEPAAERPIPPAEWRALTEGRTVWYSLDGVHWGREYFHRDGETATFVTPDGRCLTAPWGWADGLYCFAYDGLHCFRHVRRDGEILAIPEGGDAAQVVAKITDEALFCGPSLSS